VSPLCKHYNNCPPWSPFPEKREELFFKGVCFQRKKSLSVKSLWPSVAAGRLAGGAFQVSQKAKLIRVKWYMKSLPSHIEWADGRSTYWGSLFPPEKLVSKASATPFRHLSLNEVNKSGQRFERQEEMPHEERRQCRRELFQ